MFGWLWPKPPLAAWEKAWTEKWMHWLSQELGTRPLIDADVVLPTEDLFPESPAGDGVDTQQVFELLCDRMGVGADKVQLELHDDDPPQGQQSRQGQSGSFGIIHVSSQPSPDPQLVVATLARSLAHHVLEQRGATVPGDETNRRRVVELLPTYLGLGIFTANCCLAENNEYLGEANAWSFNRHGQLPARMLGYALALFAWVRDEFHPPWTAHLRLDASAVVRGGLRYLRRTNDSLFQQATLHVKRDALSLNQLARDLERGTPSSRIAALWDLRERTDGATVAVAPVERCLRDRDPHIRAEAAVTLASFGPHAEPSIPLLVDRLRDNNDDVRAVVVRALVAMGVDASMLVNPLTEALRDESPRVVAEAAIGLQQFGAAADSAQTELFEAFRQALVACHHENAHHLAQALRAVVPDPAVQVLGYFDEYDSDLKEAAREYLQEPQGQP